MSAPSKAGIYKLDNPTRVKVSHQLGTELTRGQVFHFTETSNGLCENNGEHGYGVSGSKFAAGKLTVMSELGRSVQLPNGYRIEAEKVTKRNGCTEVGLVHSSMPLRHVEGTNTRAIRKG